MAQTDAFANLDQLVTWLDRLAERVARRGRWGRLGGALVFAAAAIVLLVTTVESVRVVVALVLAIMALHLLLPEVAPALAGKPRVLSVHDAQGRPRGVFGVLDDGTSGLFLTAADGRQQVLLFERDGFQGREASSLRLSTRSGAEPYLLMQNAEAQRTIMVPPTSGAPSQPSARER